MSTTPNTATNNDLFHVKTLATMTIDAIKAGKPTEALANLNSLVNFASQFPYNGPDELGAEIFTQATPESKPAVLTPEVREVLEEAASYLQRMLDFGGEIEDLLERLLHPELFEEVEPAEPITNPLVIKVHERGTAAIASLDHEQLSALADMSGSFIANAVVKECKSRGIEVYEE